MFFINYICREQNGTIVESFNDTSNVFLSRKTAKEEAAKKVVVFNTGCVRGVWEGKVVQAF